MTEQLLATEVRLAAPLALRERRKLRGWKDAVYYLELEGGRMMVLRFVDDDQALDVFYFDKDTCQTNAPSIGQHTLALTRGKTLSLNGVEPWQARTSYPKIEAVFACSRELQTADEVRELRVAPKVVTFNLTSYDELAEVTLSDAPDGTWFYGVIKDRVFQFTRVHDFRGPHIKVEEMLADEAKPPRVMFLDEGYSASRKRNSRRKDATGKTMAPIGPFDRLFSSDKPMSADEVKSHLHIAGRHQARPR